MKTIHIQLLGIPQLWNPVANGCGGHSTGAPHRHVDQLGFPGPHHGLKETIDPWRDLLGEVLVGW